MKYIKLFENFDNIGSELQSIIDDIFIDSLDKDLYSIDIFKAPEYYVVTILNQYKKESHLLGGVYDDMCRFDDYLRYNFDIEKIHYNYSIERDSWINIKTNNILFDSPNLDRLNNSDMVRILIYPKK